MIYKPEYIFWSKFISVLIGPWFQFLNLFRKKYNITSINVKTILVTEYHRIGDVIIIAPVLKSFKTRFPKAKIILVCSEKTKGLAEELKLADKVFGISVPWTNWNWSFLKWYRARCFAKSLQSLNIDIGINFKGDIRDAWFLWNARPKISLGYDTTGGKYFFSDPNVMNHNLDQFSRAKELIKILGCLPDKEEKNRFHSAKDGFVVLHPGASEEARSWPDSYWIELVCLLIPKFKVSVVVTSESFDLIKSLRKKRLSLQYFEGSLVDFSQYIKSQKCLIAPDSMAGHLSSYFGIPVISLFGSQDPSLTKPKNKFGKVIKPKNPCSHISKHWRLCKLCMESISPKTVYQVALRHISYIESVL